MPHNDDEIKVSKRVLHPEDTSLGKQFETYDSYSGEYSRREQAKKLGEFQSACEQPPGAQAFKQDEVTIAKPGKLVLTSVDPALLEVENLSFEISKEDTAKIYERITRIVTNPLAVASLLKELDTELGAVMVSKGIQFTDHDISEFIIAGKGNFIPGPPPEGYHPRRKQRLLDRPTLLKREQQNGINKDSVPKFVGFVDFEKANALVASGYVFTEEKQISRILLHGSYSHRLIFDALCCAVKKGVLSLKFGEDKELTPSQLLELLVNVKFYQSPMDLIFKKNELSLWTLTIDTVVDTTNSPKGRLRTNDEYLNPDNFNFSCRSPHVLNSLLLCFGSDLGLPNLQHYLLDSHWKAAYEMVYRVKSSMQSKDVPDSQIYTYCMIALSTTSRDPGDVVVHLPFTLDEFQAAKNPGYESFYSDGTRGIAKRVDSKPSSGDYKSWKEFFTAVERKRPTEKPHVVEQPSPPPATTRLPDERMKVQSVQLQTPSKPTATTLTRTTSMFTSLPKTPEPNPMEEAIKNNLPDVLEDILGKSKLSSAESIFALYKIAIKKKSYDCLDVLIRSRLNVNIIGDKNDTPLMLARFDRDYKAMLMLVKAGAKIYRPESSSASGESRQPLAAMVYLKHGAETWGDRRFRDEMEILLTDKSNQQQQAIIMLDYLEKNTYLDLSISMHINIELAINSLLGEKNLDVLHMPKLK